MDTAWLGDIDALDIAVPGANDQSNRPADVEGVDDGRHSPFIVFTRSTSKVSLQRSCKSLILALFGVHDRGVDSLGIAFESGAMQDRDGFLTPSRSKNKKRSSVATEDFELVSVLSWRTDECIGQAS